MDPIDEAMTKAAEHLDAQAAEPAPEPASAPSPDPTPAPAAAPSPAPTTERARDGGGRFARTGGETPVAPKAQTSPKSDANGAAAPTAGAGPATAGGGTPPQPPPAAVPDAKPSLKTPQSWKPHLRELAAKLPAEFHPILEESVRVDEHVRRALNESAQARQVAERVQQTFAPYDGIARANGMDTMQYAGSVMASAAQLFHGPQGNRPAIIAQLIKAAGVNPEDVNQFLSGQPGPAPQAPQVDPRAEFERLFREREERANEARASSALDEFLQTQPEFVNDVWQEMQVQLRAAAASGRNMTYQQAYDRACRLDESVQKALDGRKQLERAKTATAATEVARASAVSIRSNPAAPVQATGKRVGIDGAMEKARAKLGM